MTVERVASWLAIVGAIVWLAQQYLGKRACCAACAAKGDKAKGGGFASLKVGVSPASSCRPVGAK
jgi:hypothetical protein